MAVDDLRRQVVVVEDAPVGELIRDALGDTRELVRLEVALAREDLKSELAAAKVMAVAMGAASAAAIVGVTLLLVALVLGLGLGWLGAAVIGGALVILSVTLALVGSSAMPKNLFGRTAGRLRDDVEQLRERIA